MFPDILLLNIDDILTIANSLHEITQLKFLLNKEYEMKDLGYVKRIIWMEIHRNCVKSELWMTQKNYSLKIANLFGIKDTKSAKTPLANHFKLSLDQCLKMNEDTIEMNQIIYANVVGFFIYAMICTRFDIGHTFRMVTMFMSNQGKEHWNAIKWIMCHLKSFINMGILFQR